MCYRTCAGNFLNRNHATADKIHHLEDLGVGVRKLIIIIILLLLLKKDDIRTSTGFI